MRPRAASGQFDLSGTGRIDNSRNQPLNARNGGVRANDLIPSHPNVMNLNHSHNSLMFQNHLRGVQGLTQNTNGEHEEANNLIPERHTSINHRRYQQSLDGLPLRDPPRDFQHEMQQQHQQMHDSLAPQPVYVDSSHPVNNFIVNGAAMSSQMTPQQEQAL